MLKKAPAYILSALCLVGPSFSIGIAAAPAAAQDLETGAYPQQTGEALFKGICQGCHMPNAQGAVGAGAYPALASVRS